MWGPADAALSHCGGMRMRIWEGGQEVLAHAGKRSRSARDPQRIYPPLEVRAALLKALRFAFDWQVVRSPQPLALEAM